MVSAPAAAEEVALTAVQAVDLGCIAEGVPVTASWMDQRQLGPPTMQAQACTMEA